MFKTIKSCRVCDNKNIILLLNLGKQPLANGLLNKNQIKNESKFPLELVICGNCRLIQLKHTVKPSLLFRSYFWVTGTSEKVYNYRDFFFKKVNKILNNKNNFICEIASNDGFFLEIFKKKNVVLGVDPAKNLIKISKQKGIPSLNAYFNLKTAKNIVKKNKNADLVICRNVIPHIENIKQVMRGLSYLLHEDGTGVIEFHDAANILKNLHYDYIYHEHIFYFTLNSMVRTLEKFGLYVFDYFLSPISGGSYVVLFKKRKIKKSLNLIKRLKSEKKSYLEDINQWKKLNQLCENHKENLISKIFEFIKKEKKIFGYGASARSSTLINYIGLDFKIINKIFDKNTFKIRKYTPGSHINICLPKVHLIKRADLLILFAWNFKDEIFRYLKKINYKGEVLLPLPKIYSSRIK